MDFKRSLPLLLFACLIVATAAAADDPFVGDWKLNPSKSQIPDQMKVESVGGNKYAFDFGGGPETVVVDGTDQPSQVYATDTLAVGAEGDNWKVIRKRDGHLMLTAIWSLSKDGSELTDHFTGFNADQSPYHLNQVYKRKAGGPGFAGTWVRTSFEAVNWVIAFQLRPYEEGGLSIVDAASQFTGNMDFGASMVRRVDEHTVVLLRKKKDGEVSDFLQLKLSPDRKTLTITPPPKPGGEARVYVFERQ